MDEVLNNQKSSFMKPKSDWVQLWQGLLYCRRTYENGCYYSATPLDDLLKIVNISETIRFYFDEIDGDLIIQSENALAGQVVEKKISDYNIKFVETSKALRQDKEKFESLFGYVPKEYVNEFLSVLSGIGFCIDRLKREFLNAIISGDCVIHARVGSVVSDFSEVPPDIFTHYSIENWGLRIPNGGKAVLENGPTLYSIFVEDRTDQSILNTGVAGRPSSFHLVKPYFDFRMVNKTCENKLSAEALHLCEWLKNNHPNAPTIKNRSMQNKIRVDFRRYINNLS